MHGCCFMPNSSNLPAPICSERRPRKQANKYLFWQQSRFAESLTRPPPAPERQTGVLFGSEGDVRVGDVISCDKVPMTPLRGWKRWRWRDGVISHPAVHIQAQWQAGICGSCYRHTGETLWHPFLVIIALWHYHQNNSDRPTTNLPVPVASEHLSTRACDQFASFYGAKIPKIKSAVSATVPGKGGLLSMCPPKTNPILWRNLIQSVTKTCKTWDRVINLPRPALIYYQQGSSKQFQTAWLQIWNRYLY